MITEARRAYLAAYRDTHRAELRDKARLRDRRYRARDRAVHNAEQRARRAADLDAAAMRERRRRYGITEDQYAELLAAQGGLCAICRQPERDTFRGQVKRLQVDHDHKTRRIRGLLCGACNRGVGNFLDDPELMRAAIAYIAGGNHG